MLNLLYYAGKQVPYSFSHNAKENWAQRCKIVEIPLPAALRQIWIEEGLTDM